MKIIKGVKPSPRRIMLYGPHGVGKGTWASHAPHPIFLDIEGGLEDTDCERTEKLGTIQQVCEALNYLVSGNHNYKTCVIDSVDWLEQLIHKKIVADEANPKIKSVADIGYGKGYARSTPIWSWIISQLEQLRTVKKMAVILISHAKVERYESPDSESYDRYSPDLHKSSCGLLQEWCDEVLFATWRVYTKKSDEGFNRSRTMAVGGKERYIRTCESASSLAKNRLNLPEELPLEWSAYMAAVNAHYGVNVKQAEFTEVKSADVSGLVIDGSSKKKEIEDKQSEEYKELLKDAEHTF
jgi:hypothetical protein